MKTSLETLNGLKRLLTVELPIDLFRQKIDAILRKMASQVSIDGFRKGKVPLSILRKQFGDRASTDAVNDIVNETLGDALLDAKITPAARPEITKIDSKSQDVFSYTLEFEVYPEVEVADFSALKVEQIQVDITEADEEKTLQDLIDQSTEFKTVERKSKMGDQVTVDFKGTIDGEAFEGGEAKDIKLILGKSSMIQGFEEGVTDMAAEQTTHLDLAFPDNYRVTKLAGKAVIFDITVTDVAGANVPKLDNAFAEKFGEKDMDALKKSMKEQMRVEIDNRLANQNKDALFGALLEANDISVPQGSIDAEAQNLMKEMQERMQQQNSPMPAEMPAATFNPEAERRVKLGLLIAKIASDNDLTASKQQLDAQLEEMSQAYGENAQKMIEYYHEDPARLSSVELLVVEGMVQTLVLAKADVTVKNKKFQEVTQQT